MIGYPWPLNRRLTKHALLNDQLRLEGKRNKLKLDIQHFQATMRDYIPRGQGVSSLSSAYSGEEWEDVEEHPDVDEPLAVNNPESSSNQVNAEAVVLQLPSSLGKAELERIGKAELIDHELRLREGQANDALHRLRMTIIRKNRPSCPSLNLCSVALEEEKKHVKCMLLAPTSTKTSPPL